MEEENGNVIVSEAAPPLQTSDFFSAESNHAMDNDEFAFGWGKVRPKCFRFLNCPVGLAFVFGVYNMFLGIAAWGLPSLVLPSIERRFSFSSKELGVISSSNDVTAVLFVVFISYYGDYGNKIKWMAAGATTTGVGIILFALPHFIIGRYHPGNAHSGNICSHGNSTLAQCAEPNSGGDWYYLALFVLAMLIMGAGGGPYFCLFNAYLDENVEPKSFPVYLGIFTVIQFIAPATGFLLGGKFLSIYVDINQPDGLKLSPKDPQWIGAWWLGFLIFGVAILFCSFVMSGFPRQMRGAREKRLKHIREGNVQASNNIKHPSLRKMPGELKELLKNFTFLFNVLGFTCLTFYAGPIGAFLTKIVRLKFGLDAVNAGYFVSTVVIAGSVLGIVAGTIIVRMFSLKTTCKKAAAACVIAHLLAMGGAFIFMIPACENTNMAAVSVRYTSNATGLFTPQCLATCNCSLKTFSPVCGSDNITYFDACHAGCTAQLPDMSFTNCSCISSGGLAKPGYCNRQCKNVVIFIMIIVITSAIRFSTGVPSKTVILRCVPNNKRAFASGVWYVTFKTLGLLPSPVIFGHIMDESCTLWQSICGKRGRCFDYDVASLGTSIAYFGFSFSVLTTFCYFLSWYYCKSGKESVCIENQETVESRETKL